MKLFYAAQNSEQPSFSDRFNQWLWPQLWPAIFEQDTSATFICSGTALSNTLLQQIAATDQLIVFGTGTAEQQFLNSLPGRCKVYCVRGPFSARLLGLSAHRAITDSSLLVAQVVNSDLEASKPREACSFMPHVDSADAAAERWQQICQQANIRYINPHDPIETVIEAINTSQLLLTEVMQAAVIADAMRVNWIPVKTSPRINTFSWQDWCASMRLPYLPYRIPPLAAYPRYARGVRTHFCSVRHWLRAGLENATTTVQYALLLEEEAIVRRLKIIKEQRSYLSADDMFAQRLKELSTCFGGLMYSVTHPAQPGYSRLTLVSSPSH